MSLYLDFLTHSAFFPNVLGSGGVLIEDAERFTGALVSSGAIGTTGYYPTGQSSVFRLVFRASNSSAIFGAASRVQPRSTYALMIIKN